MRCPRCAVRLVRDDDELKCSLCGRRYPLPPPPPPAYIACACETTFKRVVNRTRCGPCQLADLARRAREKRARKGKRYRDCEKPIDPSSKSVRCRVCQYIRESKSKRERRGEWGGEAEASKVLCGTVRPSAPDPHAAQPAVTSSEEPLGNRTERAPISDVSSPPASRQEQ